MKSVKVFAVAFVTVSAVVASFAFTSAKRVASDFSYNPTGAKRQVQASQPLSIDRAELVSTAKWASGAPTVTIVSGGTYLRGISFELDALSNGGNDGSLTLQEAIDAVENAYVGSTLPSTVTEGTAVITIKRSNSNL